MVIKLGLGVTYHDTSVETSGKSPTRAIFGYGNHSVSVSLTNLVNNYGSVATDITGVGTARYGLAAAGYGGDKAIFGYGFAGASPVNVSNLVSYLGVVATDTTGVGTARYSLAAAGYGGDKAIFGYGVTGSTYVSITNLVSNTGVVGNDVTGVGTVRSSLAAAGYGGDKAIFAKGYNGSAGSTFYSLTNLVTNTGVVGNDVTGVGTALSGPKGTGYGGDKAIIGFGYNGPSSSAVVNITNKISNAGVVEGDVSGVGTQRAAGAAAGYGGDKGIFGYGLNGLPTYVSMTNLVSNLGVLSTDVTGIGTARVNMAAASYSS